MKRFWCAVALISSMLASSASAQSLETARRHYLSAEFEESVAAFLAVLDAPSLSREDAVEAHRYLMVLRHMLGDASAARDHAQAALALDMTASAPEGAPPEVAQLLDEARRAIEHTARFAIAPRARMVSGETATITARLDPAPPALFSELELRCASGSQVGETRGAPPEVSVDVVFASETVLCRATARTRAGAALIDQRAELDGAAEASVEASLAPASSGPDVGWVVFGVVTGLAVVGAGVAIALALLLPQSSGPSLGAPEVVGW